ncbi:MAG: hypothetical protein HY704_13400 [Gemmatimonadetes bacterium]|nr:hypothetical protein [Gemmatimonadota bacterium]
MREVVAASLADIHSHLVPGVDDGASDVEQALAALERLVGLGVTTIVTTPHIQGSLSRNPEALAARLGEVDSAWAAISEAAAELLPELEFRRGHEVMLDVPDADFSDERLRLAGTSFALIEWPRFQIPPGTVEVVSRLRFGGVKPVVAHVERYMGVGGHLDLVAEWRRAGAYLQVNYGAVVGRWGPRVRSVALALLELGWVDYLASDYHGQADVSVYLEEARELLEGWGGQEQWRLLAAVNPARILSEEEPIPAQPLHLRRGPWERLRAFFAGS